MVGRDAESREAEGRGPSQMKLGGASKTEGKTPIEETA